MCGRYTLAAPLGDLVDIFQVSPPDFDYRATWNAAPSQYLPTVIGVGEGGRRMGPLRWGLVPFWAKDPSIAYKMINARSETAAEKPAFRAAFAKRRCLVPADGFYEWEKAGEEKVPHWLHLPERKPFAMAGLWERWAPEGEDPLFTFTILTTQASPDIRHIHPRMPVILPPDTWESWLDPERTPGDLQPLLQPLPEGSLEEWPVSTDVNSPRNDGPELVAPVTAS